MSFRNDVFEGVRHVVVDNLGSGSITVEPGPRPDLVELAVNTPDQAYLEQVQVRHEREYLRISFPRQLFADTSVHLRLGVPDGLDYVIRTGSADISITAPIGRSRIASGSGDVSVGDAVDLDVTTGSGTISIGSVAGQAVRLASGSGDVSVGRVRCPATAKSGSGDLVVRDLRGGDLRASSGSGDITVAATTGSVDLRSASGSLTVGVADRLAAWLDLNSVTGEIRIALDSAERPAPGEPYLSVRARTASGSIAVYRS